MDSIQAEKQTLDSKGKTRDKESMDQFWRYYRHKETRPFMWSTIYCKRLRYYLASRRIEKDLHRTRLAKIQA